MKTKVYPLTADQFFNIEKFSHKKIFLERDFVWKALNFLNEYIEGFSHSILCDTAGVFLEEKESISIGRGCKIGPYVHIEGPCIIGDDCDIRSCAYIRKGTIIGDNCVIGHATEVTRSIVMDNARLPHFNYVGDSIIGNGVNMGAGSVCANVRLDKGEIVITMENQTYRTNLKKLGAMIGDHISIGCNAVLNPGTIISPKALIKK